MTSCRLWSKQTTNESSELVDARLITLADYRLSKLESLCRSDYTLDKLLYFRLSMLKEFGWSYHIKLSNTIDYKTNKLRNYRLRSLLVK